MPILPGDFPIDPAIYPTQRILVETAFSLPPGSEAAVAGNGENQGWTKQPRFRLVQCTQGQGLVLGSAHLLCDYGQIRYPDDAQILNYTFPGNNGDASQLTDLLQYCIRLSIEVTPRDPNTAWTPFWWGTISEIGITSDESGEFAGGVVSIKCVDILASLATNYPNVAPERAASANGFCIQGFIPPVNAMIFGDMSAVAQANGLDQWDLTSTDDSQLYWTAFRFLNMLLNTPPGVGIGSSNALPFYSFIINDPTNALAYTLETIDFNGHSYLEIINSIINAKRGLTYSTSVSTSSGIPVLVITVAGSVATAVDLSGDLQANDISVHVSSKSQYDQVELQADHPWIGGTLILKTTGGSLTPDWNRASDATWLKTDPLTYAYAGLQYNYKRFAVVLGAQQSAFTRDEQQIASSSGGQCKTGVNINAGAGSSPGSILFGLRLENDLPGKVQLQTGPTQPVGWNADPWVAHGKPVIVVDMTPTGGGMADMSARWSLSVSSNPPIVTIDDHANGHELQPILDGGNRIYVTIGSRDLVPMSVSWINQTSTPPAAYRTKIIRLPNIQYWMMADQAVSGTTGTALVVQTGNLVVRDDTAKLNHLLTLAVDWYSQPSYAVSWSVYGLLDISAQTAPGALMTTFRAGAGMDALNTNAVFTSRSYSLKVVDGCEMWVTHYETCRIIGDIEAFTTGADATYKGI